MDTVCDVKTDGTAEFPDISKSSQCIQEYYVSSVIRLLIRRSNSIFLLFSKDLDQQLLLIFASSKDNKTLFFWNMLECTVPDFVIEWHQNVNGHHDIKLGRLE